MPNPTTWRLTVPMTLQDTLTVLKGNTMEIESPAMNERPYGKEKLFYGEISQQTLTLFLCTGKRRVYKPKITGTLMPHSTSTELAVKLTMPKIIWAYIAIVVGIIAYILIRIFTGGYTPDPMAQQRLLYLVAAFLVITVGVSVLSYNRHKKRSLAALQQILSPTRTEQVEDEL